MENHPLSTIVTPCDTCPLTCKSDSWHHRSCKTLVKYSIPADSFYNLKSQWVFSGELNDYGEDEYAEIINSDEWPNCELCGHEKIRYGYKIKNTSNGFSLVIGSNCILHFGLSTKQELEKIKRDYIGQRNVNETINFLNRMVETGVLNRGFLEYYEERGGFTPSQGKTVLDILNRNKIPLNEKMFKIRLQRDREKAQLIEFGPYIVNCLNTSQKQRYLKLITETK